jgi:uncharacterized protein (TIGR00297 family)
MHNLDIAVLFFLLVGAAASAHWRKLTPPAAAAGALCGIVIYTGDGFRGLALLALFFALGTAATAWKKEEKGGVQRAGPSPSTGIGTPIPRAAAHQSTRRTGQVLANAGVAAIAGLLALFFPANRQLFSLMLAASLSSATADTLSSELGIVYGHRFFNILTLKPDERGLDGVISLEGLFLGIIGSALVAAVFLVVPAPPAAVFAIIPLPPDQHAPIISNSQAFLILIISGTVGNLADSLLGASLERRGLLTNDRVNFLNTLIAALTAAALTMVSG